jgi:hypothetical protein
VPRVPRPNRAHARSPASAKGALSSRAGQFAPRAPVPNRPSFPSSSLWNALVSEAPASPPPISSRRKQSFRDICIPKLELGNEGSRSLGTRETRTAGRAGGCRRLRSLPTIALVNSLALRPRSDLTNPQLHTYALSPFRFLVRSNRHRHLRAHPPARGCAPNALSRGLALAIVLPKSDQETSRHDRQSVSDREHVALQAAAVR